MMTALRATYSIMKLGATGRYPQGSYGRHDEGELRFAVGRDRYGNVQLDFGKPVAWFALPPTDAVNLARLILQHAGAKNGQSDEADVALIAAAPDLLAALNEMIRLHGRPHREEWINEAGFMEAKHVDALARAAIAKAQGTALACFVLEGRKQD